MAGIFDTTEGILAAVLVFVSCFVIADFTLAAGSPRDHGNGSGLAPAVAQQVGVIAFVSQQICHQPGLFKEIVSSGDVG